MKQIFRRHVLLGLLIFTALVSVVPSQVFAVSGSVRFSQSGGQVIVGNEISLDVIGNVPKPVTWPFYGGGTTLVVTYDASRLQEIGHSDSGGVFSGGSKNWNGTTNGTVKYQSTVSINAPAVNNQKIITLKFKALTTGNATISFGSGTSVHDGPTSTTPATFTLIAPSCPAGQIGTPPNCTTPPPPPPPAPKPSAATPKPSIKPATPAPAPVVTPAPTIEETPEPVVESDGGLRIENVKTTTNRETASVSWTLNKAEANPTVSYGLSKASQKLEAKTEKQDDGSYTATFASLKPGTLYSFSIKASTPDNLQGATYGGTLTTRGYPVQLTVQQNGVLAPGAKVTIGTRSFYANKNAIISTELGDGKFEAQVTPTGSTKSYSATFTVAKKVIPASGNPELQAFTLDIKVDNGGAIVSDDTMTIITGSVIAAIAGIGGFIGFLLYRRKKTLQNEFAGVDTDLLAANYGALDSYATNTPEPNLDPGLSPLAMPAQDQPDTETYAMPAEEQTLAEQLPSDIETYQEQPYDAYTGTQQASNFDPSALPLPPTPQPADPSYYYQGSDGAPMPPTLTEQELYQSAELAQIESESVAETTSIDPDEPSAVYDEETGELDIIHHHQHAQTADIATPINDETTLSDSGTQPQIEQNNYAEIPVDEEVAYQEYSTENDNSAAPQPEQEYPPSPMSPLTPPPAASH